SLKPYGDLAWRAMFWIGIGPALFVLWIRKNVAESPVWLKRQKHLRETRQKDGVSLPRIFRRDLPPTTLQTSALVGGFMFSYHSISVWYASFLREMGRSTLACLVAFNLGSIVGKAFWGRVSEGRPGRRGAATIAALAGIGVAPLYLFSAHPSLLFLGALLLGLFGNGMWGGLPAFLN